MIDVDINLFPAPLPLRLPQSNQEHVCLQGEDRVLISCDDPASLGVAAGGHSMAGSKQWITVPVPHVYVGTNWPIRVGPGEGGRRVGVGTREATLCYGRRYVLVLRVNWLCNVYVSES